ncbi:hypothetical protein CRG86_005990 [Photobacterium leiognathi]|nr:hypothetical protein CRG86_005990 [Photobacterium leiognathi]
MQSLFADNLYKIDKHYGASKALQWSYDKPRKYKSLVTLRYEGYQLYSEKQYVKAKPILESIYQSHLSDQTDLKYLALTTLMNGKEAQALTYASKLTSLTAQQDFYNQYIEHLLATYQYKKARKELNRLHGSNELSDESIKQRDYLNSLDEKAINEFAEMTPCLKQTMNDISSGNATQAKVTLMQCDPQIDSSMWIKLADNLGLHSQIEQIDFKNDSARKLKTLVLLTHYKNQHAWSKTINLLKNNHLWASFPREFAYAYSQLKQYSKSASISFQTYKKDHRNSDLVHAVFNALQSSSGDKRAASMIEYGLQTNKQKLLADRKIVNNILDIAQRNVELFSHRLLRMQINEK